MLVMSMKRGGLSLRHNGMTSFKEVSVERGYRLLPDKKLIVVNAIVRLSGIQFSKAHMGTRGCHGEAIRIRNYGGV